MLKLPVTFSSSASAGGEFTEAWPIESGPVTAFCAVPAEFGGPGGGFSPEDLFLQALMNCFIGTFRVYARASRIKYAGIAVKGTLTVDRDPNQRVLMKHCVLEVEVRGAEQPDRVGALIAKVMKDGFILNSVKTEIDYRLKILT